MKTKFLADYWQIAAIVSKHKAKGTKIGPIILAAFNRHSRIYNAYYQAQT